MFSMPMALLRLELNGPDFFLVGLLPGMMRDCQGEETGSENHDSYSHNSSLAL